MNTLTVTPQGDSAILLSRAFNAPRSLVWQAYTEPELVKRWLGVRAGWTLPICEIDLRVGGRYRYVWRKESKGMDMGMSGTYREIQAPARLVCTETFDDPWYPGESLVTATFVEQNGQTTLNLLQQFATPEARDAVLRSGMERGVAESYDMLAALLPTFEQP